MDTSALLDSLHPLESKVLSTLKRADAAMSDAELAEATRLEPSQVSMAVGWLLTKELLALSAEHITPMVSLTDTGHDYCDKTSPPEWILRTMADAHGAGNTVTVRELQDQAPFQPTELSRAIGLLKKDHAIQLGAGGALQPTDHSSPTVEMLRVILTRLREGKQKLSLCSADEQALIRQYAMKRGSTREPFRVEDDILRTYVLTPDGRTVSDMVPTDSVEEVSQLTPEMLKDGSWRQVSFRKYSISLRPPRLAVGRRHAYREFLDSVKQKLMGMGFQEMRGELVETEFWDMDALYMPQFHPARAIHDVYFVRNPTHAKAIAEPYLSQVAEAHKHGGATGSKGWQYAYDPERARRLVLRSQGTAVSARTLASNPQIPGKYFSIARCFRYDQVDATHATDFFQVEGIVLGHEINFRTLLGLLNLFASEMAQAKEIKFLPAYFPFTEPSVELHVRHPRLGWMELGGAGLFRPEVTIPLGVNVPVIAWGLGLDRMAMVALGIHDIRDLFTSDLEAVRNMRRRF